VQVGQAVTMRQPAMTTPFTTALVQEWCTSIRPAAEDGTSAA
jgi:hypothetical protein